MAASRSTTLPTDDEDAPQQGAILEHENPVQPEARISLEPVPTPIPTLDDAFMTLCMAMEPRLDENMPALMHCQEIQGWFQNGNYQIAWQHAIQLLEGVLGVPLMTAQH